jgi:hypothetical protein
MVGLGGTDTPSPNLPFDNDRAVVFPHATPVLRDCRTHAQPDAGGAGVPRLATLDLRSRPSLGGGVPNGTLLPRSFAGVRGTTFRGPCVPPSGTAASRVPGSAASDFASPRTNPFPLSQRHLRGVGGVSPPAPPDGESKNVIPLPDETPNRQTLSPQGLLLPPPFCGILLPHTSSTLHPKRPDETYPEQVTEKRPVEGTLLHSQRHSP